MGMTFGSALSSRGDWTSYLAKRNGVLLVGYMCAAFAYYMFDSLRVVLLPAILVLSVVSVIYLSSRGRVLARMPPKYLFGAFGFTLLAGIIQVINGTATPFLLFALAGPSLAYFVVSRPLDRRVLYLPLYLFAAAVFIYAFRFRTLEAFFPDLSVNYVSVVMIMNVALIQLVEYKQDQRVRIHAPLLALAASLLAMGRAGILCSAILLLNALRLKWVNLSNTKKVILVISVCLPIVAVVLLQLDTVTAYANRIAYLERFYERGVESPARRILRREYMSHLTFKNALLGYNYQGNNWFIHYGLNPHNSYMRLHYYVGGLFAFVIGAIVAAGVRLWRQDKFLLGLMVAILLRAWTDNFLFLSFYDFVLIAMVLLAFGIGGQHSTKSAGLQTRQCAAP